MRGLKDDAAGPRSYLRHLEDKVRQEGTKAGRELPEGQSLQSTLLRGWVFGSDAFKEKLLKLAHTTLDEGAKRPFWALSQCHSHLPPFSVLTHTYKSPDFQLHIFDNQSETIVARLNFNRVPDSVVSNSITEIVTSRS